MRFLSLLLFFLATSIGASAQRKSTIDDAMMDQAFIKFQQIQKDRAAYDSWLKDLEQIFDEAVAKRLAYLEQLKKEDAALAKAFRLGNNRKPGATNLLPIWEAIPAPVPSLPESKAVDFDQKYGAYVNQVVVFRKQLEDMMADHISEQNTSEAAIRGQVLSQAKGNALVQQMNGVDPNMSEAQRKALAAQTKNNVMANPGAYTGVQDPGMNALTQKMMNDKAYRDRFNKMSEAEKMAEMQKYMTTTSVPRNDAAFEGSMKEAQKTRDAMAVQQLLGKTVQAMQEAALPYTEGTKLCNEFYGELYAAISRWHKTQYDALPVEVMGESREKRGVGPLDKAREALVYLVQKKEAVSRTILWNSLKLRTKLAISEYNDFLGEFAWGKAKGMVVTDPAYVEPQVAKAVYSMYEEMIRMAKEAELLTRSHKGQQEQYEVIMK